MAKLLVDLKLRQRDSKAYALKGHTKEKYYPSSSCAGAIDRAESRGGLSAAVSDSASMFQKQMRLCTQV